MNMKKTTLILFTAALLLMLPACSRALSTPPVVATPTLAFVVQNEPTIDLSSFAAQTARAAGEPKAAEATPVPGEATPITDAAQPANSEPTATPAPAAAAADWNPTPGRPSSYALQSGEWPICIARRFNVNMSDLFAANGLNLNSRPGAGTTLTIPQEGSWSSDHGSRTLHEHGSTHYVQSGETIYSIACYYGDVDPEGIIVVNGLESPYTLTGGQTINLP